MLSSGRWLVGRARARVTDDLRTDPYLRYILLLALVLGGFWLWYRVPNFRSSDEFTRLLDPMVAINSLLTDPGLDSLREGITHGRTLGATVYLYGLLVLPVYLVAAVVGDLGTITAVGGSASRWAVWNAIPSWFWSTAILLARTVNLLFAVGCVYLTYRIGTRLRDRQAGRLAAVLLVLTFGFLRSAHEFGEDVPALFFVLLVVYLAVRYVETDDARYFLAGCAFGGLAIAIKLTAGVAVVVLAVAYLFLERNSRTEAASGWRALLARHRLLAGGVALGAGVAVLGFPSVIAGGPDELVGRVLSTTVEKTAETGRRASPVPIWRWLADQYVRGLGLALVIASGGGILVGLARLGDRTPDADVVALLVTALVVYGIAFSQWEYVRVHHLLPTFPLLALLAGAALSRVTDRTPGLGRALVVILVVTSGAYAVGGDLQYATEGRDRATQWIATELPENATMDVYGHSPATAAVPHGMATNHFVPETASAYDRLYAENWDNQVYLDWMFGFADRRSDYIQLSGSERYFRDDIGDAYTLVARFEPSSPPDVVLAMGGDTYPGTDETVVILERTDRCPASPTCEENTTAG